MNTDATIPAERKSIQLRFKELQFGSGTWPCLQNLLGRHAETENLSPVLLNVMVAIQRFGRGVSIALAIGFLLLSSGVTSLVVALDLQSERCEVAGFKFSVTPSECKLLQSHGSEVVMFSVRLADMQIVKPEIIKYSHMIVRIKPVTNHIPRYQAVLKGMNPTSVTAGRSEYKLRDRTVYEFEGTDKRPVYVSRVLMTYQSDRLFGDGIEVLYQFDGQRSDFETLDSQLLKLLERIDLQ